jgi:alpha-D-ribose 1-methylphosphonate 5-triphosphate synthase subunit PhnG
MKNKTRTNKTVEKSLLQNAAEAIGSIGYSITEGKNKIVSAVHAVVDNFSSKKADDAKKVKKIIKKASKKVRTRKAELKKAAPKSSKSSKKIVKKAIKKKS